MAGKLSRMEAREHAMSVDEHTRLGAQLQAVSKLVAELEIELMARRFEVRRSWKSPTTKLAFALKALRGSLERTRQQGANVAKKDHSVGFDRSWYGVDALVSELGEDSD